MPSFCSLSDIPLNRFQYNGRDIQRNQSSYLGSKLGIGIVKSGPAKSNCDFDKIMNFLKYQ